MILFLLSKIYGRKHIYGMATLIKNIHSQNNQSLRISNHGRMFRIEMNRPEKFNAINWEMYSGIIDGLEQSNNCRKTSVTVISGVGDYYCAGNDLFGFINGVKTREDMLKVFDQAEQVLNRFVQAHILHEKPLISLVNGPAIGISVTVLALFDLVIASDKATFYTPFSSLGQSPEGCSSYTFPFLMGHSKACEMLLFDKKITAQEAFDRNLVTRILSNDNFKEEAERLITKLAELPPESLRVNKQLIRSAHKETLLSICKHESAILKQRWLSEECQQALQKFSNRKNNNDNKKL